MEDEKPTPKKFIRNCDTPLIDELGDLSPLKEMNPQIGRFCGFFLFLLSVGTELSQATGIVVEKVLAKHATATAKSQRRLEEDVSDLLKTASLPEKTAKASAYFMFNTASYIPSLTFSLVN